jgi:Carboxypeptidase regulatory-like domain/TonB dependent receptor
MVLLIVMGITAVAGAQSDTGQVVGNVTDETGAAIPNATITVTNVDNGNVLTATSNGLGEFNVLAVPRGNYAAKVSAQGFASAQQSFSLAVTQVQTLLFKLNAGAVSTTVEVTGQVPLVNTTDPTMGETIEGKQITDLPLNGLNFTNLALLTPGVTQGAYGNASSGVSGNAETFRYNSSGNASLAVNGLPPTANNYILDGADNNDDLVNTVIFFPPVYATDQFQVNTSVAPAQYGRAGGAVVVSSLKSGTNSIHGNLFWYYRSGVFNANPYYIFPGESFTARPPDNRNQFGADAGLPLIKNKLFIFGDYQGWRENSPVGGSLVTVPTALMRTGNFTELLNPALNPNPFNHSNLCQPSTAPGTGAIFDPITCQQFSYNGQLNVIDPARLNPAAVNYLNAYPLPTIATTVYDNYEAFEQQFINYNDFDVRLDWKATAKDTVFFRFSYDNSVQDKTSQLPKLPAGFGTGSSYSHARGYDIGYTRVFTQNVVNELRLAYNRDDYGYQPPFYGDPVSANLGIVNANRNLETSGGALIGGNGYEIDYTGDYGLYAVPQNNYEVTDTVSWNHGNHSFKYGGTWIRRQMEYFRPISGKGFYNVSGNGADFTGYEVSDMLASFVDNYSIGAQNGYFSNISQEDALYVQDDWRIKPRFTLNLGLRWDVITWPYESHNQQASFNIATGQVLLAGQNGVSRSIVNNDWHYFSPRVGFAWDIRGDGRQSLRGGYGIYYFPTYGGISNQLGQQPPYGGSVDYQARLGYCVAFTGQTPAPGDSSYSSCKVSSANQTTQLPQPGFPNFNAAVPPAGLSTLAVNRNNQQSDIQEWNLQLQQQVARNDVFDIAYVGNKVNHLANYYAYNLFQFGNGSPLATGLQNYPNLGSITYANYNGSSNYNALQLQYNHRAKDLTVTGAYTWSHTMDDACSTGGTNSTLCLYYDPRASYGNSNQDQRNVLSLSSIYTLPFGKGERWGHDISQPLDWLIGGWQTNLIGIVQSGQPFDLSTGLTSTSNEPDQVGLIRYPKSITGYWFDPTAFSSATIPTETVNGNLVYTRPGTMRRDQLFGPGTHVVNFGLQKGIHLTERYTVSLRGDAFNIFNTPEFTNPGASENSSTFGKITSVTFQSNRQLQLSARFDF